MSSDLEREYASNRAGYKRLEEALEPLIKRIVHDTGVQAFQIESRVKEVDSFSKKTLRKEKAGKYKKLSDVTDLCGIRIITFTDADRQKIVSALQTHFYIDEGNSIDKVADSKDNEFGYAATHMIVQLKDDRIKLFEYRDLAGLRAEIQVKTVLQHAWAVIDWSMRYKSQVEIPRELKRKLFRISALLEAADDAFSELHIATEKLKERYVASVFVNDLNIQINRDSLETYIKSSPVYKDIVDRLRKGGVKLTVRTRGIESTWSYMINSLEAANIKTLDEFDKSLRSLKDENINLIINIWNNIKDEHVVDFGPFTPFVLLVASQLDLSERIKVMDVYPVDEPSDEIERQMLFQF